MKFPELSISVLAAHAWDLPMLTDTPASCAIDWLFLWQGDVKALLAMIKQEEDRRNADHDVLEGGVQAIILVEDEVRFYSAYLPHIYTEVTSQTSRLMAEGLNLSHRLRGDLGRVRRSRQLRHGRQHRRLPQGRRHHGRPGPRVDDAFLQYTQAAASGPPLFWSSPPFSSCTVGDDAPSPRRKCKSPEGESERVGLKRRNLWRLLPRLRARPTIHILYLCQESICQCRA